MFKKKPIVLIPVFVTIFTLLWSQCVWAIGIPAFTNSVKLSSIKNLSNNLQEELLEEVSSLVFKSKQAKLDTEKDSSTTTTDKFLISSEEKSTSESTQVAFLTDPTPKIPSQNPIVYGLNNELGDVAYEKIKVSAKSGWGPFSSKSKVLTEYWYGYDEYGQHEKIKENEIYRKVSSNPLGTIIKAIVSIITIAATWGMATPVVAAWMALENFVFALLSGADIGQALIGAAISFAAAVIGAQLGAAFGGGASAATDAATGFAGFLKDGGMTMFFQALSLADSLMVDDQGRGLFEQLFGEWGSIVFDVISVLVALKSGTGNKGPPYQVYAALGRLAVSAILTALGDRIDPRLRQFISAFTTSFLNAWAKSATQKAYDDNMETQGFQKLSNGDYVKWEGNNLIRITKDGQQITDVFDSKGEYQYSEIPLRDGAVAVTDLFGNVQKYLKPQSDGSYAVYSNIGEYEGILQPGARLWIGSTGLYNGSILEGDDGRLMIFDWTGTQALERSSVGDLTIYDNFGIKEGYYSSSENIYYQYDRDQNLRQITDYKTGDNYFYNADGNISKVITGRGLTQEMVADLAGNWAFAEGKKSNAIPVYDEGGNLIAVFGTYVNNNEIAGFLMDDKVNNLYRSFNLNGDETQSVSKDDFNNYVDTTKQIADTLINLGKTLTIEEAKDLLNQIKLFRAGSTEIDLTPKSLSSSIITSILSTQPTLAGILMNAINGAEGYLEQARFNRANYNGQVILQYDPNTQTPEQVLQLAKEKFGNFAVVNQNIFKNTGEIIIETKTDLGLFMTTLKEIAAQRTLDGMQIVEVGLTVGPGVKGEVEILAFKAGYDAFAGKELTLGGEDYFKNETRIDIAGEIGFGGKSLNIGGGVKSNDDSLLPDNLTPYYEFGPEIGPLKFSIQKQPGLPFKPDLKIGGSFHKGFIGAKFHVDLYQLWDWFAGFFGFDPAKDDMSNLYKSWQHDR